MFRQLRSRLGDVGTIKQLLEEAETIARRDGLSRPAAEHLVLAAFGLPDGTARAALERAGSTPEAFVAALAQQHVAALEAVGVAADNDAIDAALPDAPPATGLYRSEASGQELFQQAGADARADGGGLLGAHVLRAAADLERGTVARAFRYMGVDRDALRASAAAEIEAARVR